MSSEADKQFDTNEYSNVELGSIKKIAKIV